MSALIDKSISGSIDGVIARIKAGDKINQKGVFRFNNHQFHSLLLFILHISMTALNWASRKGYLNISKLLIQNGADVNIPNRSNETPIFSAIKNNHYEIYCLLISYNCDITIRSFKDGRTVKYYIDKDTQLLDYYNSTTRWMRRKHFMILLVEHGYIPRGDKHVAYVAKPYEQVFGNIGICQLIMGYI